MDGYLLMFFKPGAATKLPPAEVARELIWGEEVEGLVDLPVREILDRLKAEFPRHEEKPGLLVCQGVTGSFEATWGWQFIRVECDGMLPGDRDRLIELLASFGCLVFDPQAD